MLIKWCLLLWMISVWYQSIAQYHQTDYNVNLKILEITDYNRSYISHAILGMQWYNRSIRVINGNLTVIKDVGITFKIKIQLYKFLSNEYRFFPLTMTVDGCEEMPKNMYGLKDFVEKYSNFSTNCPFKKGFYYIRNGQLDYSQFPPYMPTGDYKSELKFFYGKDFLFEMDIYGSITDSRKLWK